jgi:hypothetical protein
MPAPPTAAVYGSHHREWINSNAEVRHYRQNELWEELSINSSLLERIVLSETWEPGSVLFDVEGLFGCMGCNFTVGLWYRRMFYRQDTKVVEAPCQFIPFPGFRYHAADGVVAAAMDEILGGASFAFGGAFTAWLSVEALVPVPVGVSLLGMVEVLDVSTSPSGATKLRVRGVLVDRTRTTTYRRAEALFVRPANNPLNAARYELYHDVELLELQRRGKNLLDAASNGEIVAGRSKREEAISLIRTPLQQHTAKPSSRSIAVGNNEAGNSKKTDIDRQTDSDLGEGSTCGKGMQYTVYVCWPPALVASTIERWLGTDKVIQFYNQHCAPLQSTSYATMLSYFDGKLISHWYDGRPMNTSTNTSTNETTPPHPTTPPSTSSTIGSTCATKREAVGFEGLVPSLKHVSCHFETYIFAAVQFLNTCEGPPGSAHGGAVYALMEVGVRQALALLKEEREKDNRAVSLQPALQPTLQLKVSYRQRVPILTTLVLVCKLCRGSQSVRATLQSSAGPPGGEAVIFDEAEGTFDIAVPRGRL